jgi:hypothetical protein
MHQDEHAGRLPFRLWVGVTGHRDLPPDPLLVERIREVLDRIRRSFPASDATPLRLGMVSSLAEGADRLVAREILAGEDALLEVPLPLPRDEYLLDFTTQRSKEEFLELLGRASAVTVVPDAGGREKTYAEAGHLVVDRCDALVAIWDGAPPRGVGGTADAVARARTTQVPLYWIRTGGDGSYEVVEEPGKGLPRARFQQVDKYNRAPVAEAGLDARVGAETGRLHAEAERAGLAADLVEPALRWYLPFLARADTLSLRLQRRYYGLGMALFILAALAAVAGAASTILDRHDWQVTLPKVLLLLVLVGLSADARRQRLPARWISCRLLAEQLRAAMFLTVAGLEASRDRDDLVDPSLDWVQAAAAEVCRRGPRGAPPAAAADGLRRFLLGAWVDEQLGYLRRTGERQRRRDRLLNSATSWLFVGTLALTLADPFVQGQQSRAALTLAATGFPALAAAFSGIREQRQYVRNSERSRRVARRLERLRARLGAARDLGSVQQLTSTAGILLTEENQDWFGVMEAVDLKPTP